jgi:hypothetical protein
MEGPHPLIVLAVEQVDRVPPIVVVDNGKHLARVVEGGDRLPTSLEHALSGQSPERVRSRVNAQWPASLYEHVGSGNARDTSSAGCPTGGRCRPSRTR